MSAQLDILQGYVNDMLAVEREIHNAFSRQKHDDRVKAFPAASRVIARIEDTIDRHIKELETCLARLGGDESVLKKAVGTVMGAAAGLYDKVRPNDKVARMVRDDYTALSFATVCYQMLHTTALAVRESSTADLALAHLKAYAPLIVDLADAVPEVVVDELAEEGKIAADHSVATQAARNTRAAWEQASSQMH
jgi:hypothetical protein